MRGLTACHRRSPAGSLSDVVLSATLSPFPPLPAAPTAVSAPARSEVLKPLLDACGLGWFCVRGEGRREHVAAANLSRGSEVEAFAPRIRVRREARSGGVQVVTEALFPGYLFARFRYPDQVRRVVSTTGVLGLVAFGGPPPRLDDRTIAQLRQGAEPNPAQLLSPVFEQGDWVRVAAGCFRGTKGQVRPSLAGRDRVCVLLSLLGHDVEISLPADHLIREDAPSQVSSFVARHPGALAPDVAA